MIGILVPKINFIDEKGEDIRISLKKFLCANNNDIFNIFIFIIERREEREGKWLLSGILRVNGKRI